MVEVGRVGPAALVALLAARAPALADTPITNSNYAIDLYDGAALGNTAMVGMGGTGAALVVGSAGTLINASAPAVRPTTDRDSWSWDYHLDFLSSQYSTDYANDGHVPPVGVTGGAWLITLGASLRVHDWALGAALVTQSAPVVGSTGLTAESDAIKVVLAKYVPQLDLALGVGFQSVAFDLVEQQAPRNVALFEIRGLGAIAGATWLPRLQSFRVGAGFETAIDGDSVAANGCTPGVECQGYFLPDHVRSPWRVVGGGAYRFAATAWNQTVSGDFRDEPSLTIAADVVITGASDNAYGIDAFGMHELQRSGADLAISVRGGAEYECVPGRLRVRAGSYWEPERFEGVGGRLHGTFGADVRVFEFDLWGRRRGRISVTGDLASRYTNAGISIGFWH